MAQLWHLQPHLHFHGNQRPQHCFLTGKAEGRVESGGRSQHLPTNPISWWAEAGTPCKQVTPDQEGSSISLGQGFTLPSSPDFGTAVSQLPHISKLDPPASPSLVCRRLILIAPSPLLPLIAPLLLCLRVFCCEGCKVQAGRAEMHPALCREAPCRFVAAAVEEQVWIHRADVFFLLVQRWQRIVAIPGHIPGSLGEEGQPPDCSRGSGL